jgi:hypothetical protein
MFRRAVMLLLWPAALATLPAPASADFRVKEVTIVVQDLTLLTSIQLNLELNEKTEEALNNGIPLEVTIDANLVRHRWWWTNKLVADWTIRQRLQFHALSRQYLVSTVGTGEPAESFASLSLALENMGKLGDLKFTLTPKKQFDPTARHLLQVRARLDIETLPVVMRPLAYASPSWRLNTGWTEWPLPR